MSFFLRDGIAGTLLMLENSTIEQAEEAFHEGAQAIEEAAKANAPWDDRTGMAREGLFTNVYSEGTEIILELCHTVDYGLWLEVIQNGRFAIIMPTLEAYASQVFNDAGASVFGRGE